MKRDLLAIRGERRTPLVPRRVADDERPALVDAETTCTAIAPGWVMSVDGQGAFLLTHEKEEDK